MPAYQSPASGGIGALLRQIQEDTQESPLVNTPQTQQGSPIRDLVQQPLLQSEAPDSSRVISVRPETAPLSGGDQVGSAPIVPPSMPVAVGPVAAPRSVGPVPAPNFSAPSQAQPSAQAFQNAAPQASFNRPSIGTSLKPSVLGLSTPKPMYNQPAGPARPQPSPSPKPQAQTPSRSSYGGAIGLGTKIVQNLPEIGSILLKNFTKFATPFFGAQLYGTGSKSGGLKS